MATATPQGTAPAEAIGALADRFDPDVIDLPRGRARVRLEVTGGNVTRTAKLLKISRKSLQMKMKEFGLRGDDV